MFTNVAGLAHPDRMDAVASYDLDDPTLRARLDDVATRTAERLGFPLSMVTIVMDSAVLFAGSHGLVGWLAETGGAPAEWAFCSSVALAETPFVAPDLAADPVHGDNPLVAGGDAASYAGIPLRTASGQVIGSHCVIGVDPHDFTHAQLAALERAADEAVAILEEYRLDG